MPQPTEFPGPYDQQRSPDAGSAPPPSGGRRKSRTFWLKLEIGRSESPVAGNVTRLPVQAARIAYSEAARSRLDRILRRGDADQAQQPPAGTDDSSGPEHTARDPAEPATIRSATTSFWEQLEPTERAKLLLAGYLATFAIGDQLMREGEPADYVIVIMEGKTRVCVDENGWERDLAERGPGQLIGERGALQSCRLRSASVIAVEPVQGLVITTKAFSAFVDAHPRVFDIVESQLYDRLVEDRAQYLDQKEPDTARPGAALTDRSTQRGPLNGQHCTIVLTDVVGFGSPTRNDHDRRIIREALLAMTGLMLHGITAQSENRGDGILTVVPPEVSTAEVMRRLVKELPLALARHNAACRPSARFQLRVAINVGPVTTDNIGVAGEALIIVARLVDAPAFKEAIARTRANLGIIASPFVYDTVIKHSPNPMSLAGYVRIEVDLKELASSAWIKFFTAPASASLTSSQVVTPRIGTPGGRLHREYRRRCRRRGVARRVRRGLGPPRRR